MKKLCGPKLSLCGIVMSVWGIIQLIIMGGFFYMKAVALSEDLPIDHTKIHHVDEYLRAVDRGYVLNAYNCWLAALMYVVTLVVSAHQFWVNRKMSV